MLLPGRDRTACPVIRAADNGGMTAEMLDASLPPGAGKRGEEVDDSFLVRATLGGDPAALRVLMARYDRLVRYTIFRGAAERCRKDPQWLDSVASATWSGLVQSLNRSPSQVPTSLAAYLVRIARNQVASQLRRRGLQHDSLDALENDTIVEDDGAADTLELLSASEDLEALRACLRAVGGEDSLLLAHLEAITERRWTDAAAALGVAESTLRSRWQRLLSRLRDCVEGKTGKSFAPGDSAGD